MTTRVTRVVCAADPGGSVDTLQALVKTAAEEDAQAIALVGDLSGGDATAALRGALHALARTTVPVYWVPGPGDAPISTYLREAQNIEVVAGLLRGVHGTAAFAPDGHVVFAGFGGDVSDDPGAERDEQERLTYPRWEPEYRLKVLGELDEHQLVLLFSTPPAHKGNGNAGSEVLAELIGTHRPRLVVSGGEQGTEILGHSLIVAPGSLRDGHYAIVYLHTHEARFEQLGAVAEAT